MFSMRHFSEAPSPATSAPPAPEVAMEVDAVEKPFPPELLQALGIQRGPRCWKSPMGNALVLALGLAGGFTAKGEPLHATSAQASERASNGPHAPARRNAVELRSTQEHAPSIHVEGFQELGIDGVRLSENLRDVLSPFMDRHPHRIGFTRASAQIGGAYFGLRPGVDMGSRWVELAHHQQQADGSHEIVVREAALGGPHHVDVQHLLRNVVHEIIHGMGHEHLPYFVQRVQSGSMIPFRYTNQFLEAGRRGATVDYEHMGEEYRSKLLEAFFAARYVPEEGSFREAVIRHILDRYDVPNRVVEEDVDQVLSWAPSGTWERATKAYQRLLRETGIEFERHTLDARLIRPFQDDVLRSELTAILHRAEPTLVQRLAHLPADGKDASRDALIRDVQEYQQTLIEQIESNIQREYPEVAPFLGEWKRVVEVMTRRNQYHLKTFFTHGPSSAPMTDADHIQDFVSGMELMDVSAVNAGWSRISPEVRESLRSTITEYTRVVSGVCTLPGEYQERVRRVL